MNGLGDSKLCQVVRLCRCKFNDGRLVGDKIARFRSSSNNSPGAGGGDSSPECLAPLFFLTAAVMALTLGLNFSAKGLCGKMSASMIKSSL